MTNLKSSSKNPGGRLRKCPTYPHATGTGNVLKLVTSRQLISRSVVDMLHETIGLCKRKGSMTAAVAVVLHDGSVLTNYVTPCKGVTSLQCARAMETAARRIAEGDD